ncbi:acyl-CoA dehydrogenase family protein [Oryzihumus leptocrescens]|uniref:Acyl-CoA dehydrogenase n=1 Tax=Oryzihumus leptocrescens TaxID=297536 RepID=A0A542Z9A9_9MICO|nr:acyl-CoA dehydrogenase family protein [Oryzihumus leptocrescens]TQL56895.1 acyl-CoA dehydrogenase [Oryzihumus leptocrescens]
MDFGFTPVMEQWQQRVQAFLDEVVYPAEATFYEQVAAQAQSNPWGRPPVMAELKAEAQRRGLWNLFLPGERGAGLSNLEYAPLAELSGRSPMLAPEAMNCAAPDTGNMEVLAHFATPAVQRQWLEPLLRGEIRSAYSMTEPEVASSDANNIATRIEVDDDELVVTGRKWWSSGAMAPECKVAIVMGLSDPDGERHQRHSMVVVPLDTPGVDVRRSTHVLGYTDGPHGGHAEIVYDAVRVPRENLLGELHRGFAIGQARLGPGRIHHCMRLIGMAERAYDLMCERVQQRVAFGKPLAAQGVVQEWVAEARIRIEQARLLVLKTAWLMDTVGNRGAAVEISAIKVAVPEMATWVIDRAMQAHGGMGVCQDTVLPELYAQARMLHLADGPDEVHRMALARRELKRYA